MRGTLRECLRAKLVDTGRWEMAQFDALSDGAVDAMAFGMKHAWVIAIINPSMYWAGGPPETFSWGWTTSLSKAVRFARVEDAAVVTMGVLRTFETKITGHIFS